MSNVRTIRPGSGTGRRIRIGAEPPPDTQQPPRTARIDNAQVAQVTTKRTKDGGKLEVKFEAVYADPEQADQVADLIRCQHETVTLQITASPAGGDNPGGPADGQ